MYVMFDTPCVTW